MTGYERINTTLKGGCADKVPLMLHSFMPAAAEAGFTMTEYRNSARNMADSHLKFARKYGLDGILLDVDTCMEAGAVGVPIDFPEDGTPRVKGPASDNIDGLMEMVTPEKLHTYDRIKIQLEAVAIMKKEAGGELFIRGNCDQMAFSLAMLSYGMENFLADLLDDELEEKIILLIDRALDVHLEYHRMMLEAGADITSFGDSSCGPDVISPELFLKYSLPFHKKLHQELAKMNAGTICHICGNLDRIIDDVAAIGYAGVEIDYKTNIENAARVMKNRSVVFGPIDPSGVFYFGTPELMRKKTGEVLDYFRGRGIVLGAGCAIPKGAPEELIRTFVETARLYPL
ncbi:uroporphyrinogen decarboxylase family protein [Treponema sp. TIM-1]|uniref:uroporphyrinogen decarboxylase family protein n=1 Tax=Treponema sp. TIM-1 TaxID=2898417 RepID=UPI003981875A